MTDETANPWGDSPKAEPQGSLASAVKRGPGRPRKEEAPAHAPVRARPTRAQEERVERRRRRSDLLDGTARRLDVSQEVRDEHHDCEFRWINDDGMSFQTLTTQDDWEPVEINGKIEKRYAGLRRDDRTPMQAVLCKKPKAWCDEDRQKEQKRVDEQISAVDPRRVARQHGIDEGAAYVPEGWAPSLKTG